MLSKSFNLNLIPVFCSLIETHSVSVTARRLGVASSAVSYSLRCLRDHYNDPLMVRTGEGMKPTSKALSIYKKYRAIMELIEPDLPSDLSRAPNINKIYRIRTHSLIEVWVVKQIIENNTFFDGCTFDFISPETTNDHRIDSLRQKFVDIDLGTPLHNDYSIKQYPGLLKSAKLVCRRNHPRITSNQIDECDIINEKLIHWMSYNESSAQLPPVFSNEIFSIMNVPYRSTNTLCLMATISISDMIGIIPEKLLDFYCDIFNLKPISTTFTLKKNIPISMHIQKNGLKDPVILELTKIINEKFLI